MPSETASPALPERSTVQAPQKRYPIIVSRAENMNSRLVASSNKERQRIRLQPMGSI